nr:hypothetical protein [uncultured Allomuricauda sp.]
MKQLTKILAVLFAKLILLLLLFGSNSLNAQRKSTSVRIDNKKKTSITVSNPFGKNFSVEYEGEIKLSEDDKDIAYISPGGYMEIKRSAFGSRRRIFIEPDDSGRLIKKYYVGSSQKSFEGEGEKWLAEILLDVVRTTTLGSQQRVDRIYKKRGAYGVLKEVGYMDSNHVKSRYLKLLLKKNLKNPDIALVLKAIENDVDSDYHRADILKSNTSRFLSTEANISAYINAASQIDSDHHKAEVLKQSIKERDLTENQMKSMLVVAKDIDSDHHKSSVLLTALKSNSLNDSNIKLLASTSKSIDSDHHRANVLKTAINNSNLPSSGQHTFLNALEGMSSDYHIDDVLSKMVNKGSLESSAISHVIKCVGYMDSDSHQANVLKKLVQKQQLSDSNTEDFVFALGRVSSDSHTADVLRYASKLNLNDKQLMAMFEAIRRIDSDHHKADSLVRFADQVSQSGTSIQEAYLNTCRSINSDSHYRRALDAIQ